jgi:hypothetical protein
MTDTTHFSRLAPPQHSKHEIASEAVSIPLNIPSDTEEAVQIFLNYYESFVEGSVDDPLLWQSQSFSGKQPSDLGQISPWITLGILGVGGVSVLVAANTILLRTDSPSKTQKSAAQRQQNQTTQVKRQVVPEPSTIEFSTAPTQFERVQVPKIVSPSIRAPLPGQVIRRQSSGIEPAPVAEVKVLQKSAVSPSKLEARKARTAPTVLPAPATPKLQASPTSPAPALTTPMPPQVAPSQGKSQISKSDPLVSTVLPILTAAVQKQIGASTLSVQQEQPPQTLDTLKKSISSAQTIQDFLELSPKIPQNLQVAIAPLSLEAALAVPNVEKFEEFQVFRFSPTTYQKIWAVMMQSQSTNPSKPASPSPANGFIDYLERTIVLVSS